MNKKIILFTAVIAGSLILGYISGVNINVKPVSKKDTIDEGADYNKAIFEIQEYIKKNPNDAKALSALGDAYFELQRFGEATDIYKKAITMDPDDIDSCNDLALCLHYTGKYQEALQYIDACIKRNPAYQRIWLTKGFILSVNGKLHEARKAWETAYKMAPNSEVGKAAEAFLAKNR